MKILKLLNKLYLSIFIIIISLLVIEDLKAEEELVDIWKIEKNEINEKNINDTEILDNTSINESINTTKEYNSVEIINNSELEENKIILAGIYDPADNGLSIDMWSNSDGNEIIKIFNRLKKIKLSNQMLKKCLNKLIKVKLHRYQLLLKLMFRDQLKQ